MALTRITRIKLERFKNVTQGEVLLHNPRRPDGGSFLALYGQNGSGKTAMIDALDLLKVIMSGGAVSDRYVDLIEVGSSGSKLEFEFLIKTQNTTLNVFFDFELLKRDGDLGCGIEIGRETLSVSENNNGVRQRKTKVIDTNSDELAFIPEVRLKGLVGSRIRQSGRKDALSLFVKRQNEHEHGRSFIFSNSFGAFIAERLKVGELDDEWKRIKEIIDGLVFFARQNLFVISSRESSLIALDALILSCNLQRDGHSVHGKFAVKLTSSEIPEALLPILQRLIGCSNIVLSKLIPGLTIGVREIGRSIMQNGEQAVIVQLMSERNGKVFGLQYESDGIKKLFSILHLLIAVYNDSSVTVAIDEIDAGIFEYLLGELLQLLTEKGKGQLIFTCHNLRPLEMIDHGYIVFTTTNPSDRYSRISNVKNTNNLRDVYYREVSLGDGKFYNHTSAIDIGYSFRKAWGYAHEP